MSVLEESYVEMDCEDFLEVVYGEREGWIDLPAKVGSYWVPFYTEWPNDGTVSRRIDSSLRDREDLYYSVATFAERGRAIEHVLPSLWLWADLDEVHPTEGARLGFLPTVAVESSPGRYQALWRLTRELKPRALEKLNRGLSYALDADRGGWDLTQVLRIPGTRNFKYQEGPIVRVLWYKPELEYDPTAVWAAVRQAVPAAELKGATSVVLPRRPLPRRAKELLRTSVDNVVEGERSARLWELNCLLAESGLSSTEIFPLVWPCSWNKWRGVSSGSSRLKRDIQKAIAHVQRKEALRASDKTRAKHHDVVERDTEEQDTRGQDGPDDVRSVKESGSDRDAALPWVGYSSFMAMAMEEPRWLVEDIWTAGSHGLIAGEPKTQKTTLALSLALSVASGEPFLDKYAVGVQGPVLMVQEENAPWMMQDRLRKIAAMYGLISKRDVLVRTTGAGALGSTSLEVDFPADVPLKLLNNYGFDLGLEEHRDMLEAEVEETKPVLLILDPLYLILPADQNQSAELRPFLQWLLKLRYEYNCAIMVIHHMRKQSQGSPVVRAGQRVLGSATLHGWVDSAIYTGALEEKREGWVKTIVEREFRSMAPQRPLELALSMGEPGSLVMDVEIDKYDLGAVLYEIVSAEPGVTVADMCKRLDKDKRTLLVRLRGDERFKVVDQGRGRGKSHQVWVRGEGQEPPEGGEDD